MLISSLFKSHNYTSYMATKSVKSVLPESLYKSGLFSDLTLNCNSRIFKIHRCIVSQQCPFFYKALLGEFEEASSQTIDLHDDDPFIVEKMLHYLYEGTYEASISEPIKTDNTPTAPRSSDETPAHIHARVYHIGDKYGITGLMRLAKGKFERDIQHWNLQDINFISVIALIYSTSCPGNSGLRGVLTKEACFRIRSLNGQPEFLEALKAHPDFAFEFLQITMEKFVELEDFILSIDSTYRRY
ncbi:hypothetical protein Egran_00240 [Elaphomyces granulatus]|uniref:BTB domain-containing protein n=1 Tax=Elaphomyces granulatus TaxID=519963 RepID=A0A232M6I1_9EURO|nr:hypothetical protein Egran_00240 [Elaphomyces granulatus]